MAMNVAIVCPFNILRSGLCEQVHQLFPDWVIQVYRYVEEITPDKLKAINCIMAWYSDPGITFLAHRDKTHLTITCGNGTVNQPTIDIYDTSEELLHKLQTITSGLQHLEDQPKNTGISTREKEIIRLVALGKTNKEIADELFISAHTVITHRKNISQKLGIKTIAGLTMYALMQNLIPADGQIIRI